jgi:hypothetical protein
MAIQLVTLPPVTVSVANTAVPLASTPIAVTSVTITADPTNVGDIYFGGSNVTVSNGQPVPARDSGVIQGDSSPQGRTEEFFLNEVYINSATSGNSVRIIAFARKP